MSPHIKKNKKFGSSILKLFVIFGVCLMLLAGSVLIYIFSSVTYYNHTIPFDAQRVLIQNSSPQFFDISGEEIQADLKNKYITLDEVSSDFKEAILSVEDKEFYKHNGINYIRTTKALGKNLLNGRIKEGGSTISQQLVKNKFLSNERTFTRKLKEASLVLRMEKKLTKKEIFESYINSIYYGSNQYGIENASYFYFNKSAEDLNLSESATLAGIIQAPSAYSNNYDRLLKRRNLVLGMMLKDGKITRETYDKTSSLPIEFKSSDKIVTTDYINEAIYEASVILNITTKDILNSGLKIRTNLDSDMLKILNSQDTKYLRSSILINKDGRVLALAGKNNKKEPGSVVKPFFSYAPAMEMGLISPESFMSDDKVDFGGFAPSNYEGKYYGEIQIKDALKTSSNTVAVKLTNYSGVNKVKRFARKLGIKLTDKDDLSISLGHLEKGLNLTEIGGMYTALLNNGEYINPSFIDKIETPDGTVLYENLYRKSYAIRDDTAFLLNEMLTATVKDGTARKLSALPFTVGSKTGTVGAGNGDVRNTDAYNICYTPEVILLTRISSKDNSDENLLPKEFTGAGLPTEINRNILEKVHMLRYKDSALNFPVPETVKEVELDAIEFEKHNLTLANEFTPERYKLKRYFSIYNAPKTVSVNFIKLDTPQFKLTEENDMAKISFNAEFGKTYDLYKNGEIIKTVNVSGNAEIYDDVKSDETVTYKLVARQQNFAKGTEIKSEPAEKTIYISKTPKQITDKQILDKVQEFKENVSVINEAKSKPKTKPGVKFSFSRFFEVFS